MTKKRNIIKDLTLNEISGVTVPAQAHALISIMKSDEAVELVKYLSTDDGAKTFDAFMSEAVRDKYKDRIRQDVWEIVDSLRQSITSIKLDDALTPDQKSARITESVVQFNEVVSKGSSHSPETHAINSNALLKMLTDYEDSMSEDVTKKAEALEAQVAELTKSLADAQVLAKLSDAEKEYLAGLEGEDADKFKAADAATRKSMMKKSADADEVFKSAEGHEIRKSEVGDSVFAILKSQDDAIRNAREEMVKAADRAQTVELTKRADEELAHLPGDTLSKVAVLKLAQGADETTREALMTMLKAGNETIAKSFRPYGTAGGNPSDVTKATKLAAEIKKVQDADPTLTEAMAMNKVLSANPELYEG